MRSSGRILKTVLRSLISYISQIGTLSFRVIQAIPLLTRLESSIIPQMSPLPDAALLALPLQPVVLLAIFLRLQHKALGLDNVKEEISHQIGVR